MWPQAAEYVARYRKQKRTKKELILITTTTNSVCSHHFKYCNCHACGKKKKGYILVIIICRSPRLHIMHNLLYNIF